jgi:hypothetical protein
MLVKVTMDTWTMEQLLMNITDVLTERLQDVHILILMLSGLYL